MKSMEPTERDAMQEWIERLCRERDTQEREIAELDAQVVALSKCVGAGSDTERSLRQELEEVREYLATSQTKVREVTAALLCRDGDLTASQRNSELRGQKIMAAADILRRAARTAFRAVFYFAPRKWLKTNEIKIKKSVDF